MKAVTTTVKGLPISTFNCQRFSQEMSDAEGACEKQVLLLSSNSYPIPWLGVKLRGAALSAKTLYTSLASGWDS